MSVCKESKILVCEESGVARAPQAFPGRGLALYAPLGPHN